MKIPASAPKERILLIDGRPSGSSHSSHYVLVQRRPDAVFQKYGDIGFQIAATFEGIFISEKFYTFFSFLFGLSFALQMESGSFTIGRFLWRLFILGLIGLAHSLRRRGDILSIYFVVGLVMVLFRKASDSDGAAAKAKRTENQGVPGDGKTRQLWRTPYGQHNRYRR
ncbi:hypothetical protein [Runella slithyformis]|uniref:hypothetical protein n=1 Tax=Runella slithyformis TaxID=106 RepID=UPI0002D46DF6|nr:hypothetical protein [Runella slithyformis]